MWLFLSIAVMTFTDEGNPESDKKPEEKDLVKELRKVRELMSKSEEYLHEALKSADKRQIDRILEKYKNLKLNNPEIELPPAMLDESGREQKKALDKMKELVKYIENMLMTISPVSGSGYGNIPSSGQSQKPDKQEQKDMQKKRPANSPAKKPYDPSKHDPMMRFKDIKGNAAPWGLLQPKDREKINRELDDLERYPAKYREHIRAYLKKLASIKEK